MDILLLKYFPWYVNLFKLRKMKEELIFNSENHVVLINIKKLKNVYISKMKIKLEQRCNEFKGEIFKF